MTNPQTSATDALWQAIGLSSRDHVALFDFSRRTQIEFTGEERQSFLHKLCTNEIRQLAPGSGAEICVTNVQGKILGHGVAFVGTESVVVETVGGQGDALWNHFEKYHIREPVEIVDQSLAWGELLFAGPGLDALVTKLGIPLPAAPWQHAPLSGYSALASVRRVGFLGEIPSLLVSCGRDELAAFSERILAAGAKPVGDDVLEALRVAGGFPWYGVDITVENLPQELDRDPQMISFTKGCYLGQETVARIDALGHVNRLLRRIDFPHGTAPPPPGATIEVAGKVVVKITSSVPTLGSLPTRSLGYVRRGHHSPGTTLASSWGDAHII